MGWLGDLICDFSGEILEYIYLPLSCSNGERIRKPVDMGALSLMWVL